MKACRQLSLFTFALLGTCSLLAAQTPSQTPPQGQEVPGWREAGLQRIKAPFAQLSQVVQQELKKIGRAKVTLRMVVDANGRVSDVEALSGPPEFFPASVEDVNHWEFEPPAHAPVVATAEISYAIPVECPGPVSEMGSIEVSGRLFNKDGELSGVYDGEDYPMPPYPDEERKAGHSGQMVLGVRLDAEGRVKKIRAVHSLSPGLDRAAMKSFREWKFKLNDENPSALREQYELHIRYRSMCNNLP